MIVWIGQLLVRLIQLASLIVVVDVVLSYFMSPYEPIRRTLDRFINPLLNPLRRIIPPLGGLDFSPFVLIILLQILAMIVQSLFS
jgi:YggT family protein